MSRAKQNGNTDDITQYERELKQVNEKIKQEAIRKETRLKEINELKAAGKWEPVQLPQLTADDIINNFRAVTWGCCDCDDCCDPKYGVHV